MEIWENFGHSNFDEKPPLKTDAKNLHRVYTRVDGKGDRHGIVQETLEKADQMKNRSHQDHSTFKIS